MEKQISVRLTVNGDKSELVNFLRELAKEIEVSEEFVDEFQTSNGYAELWED